MSITGRRKGVRTKNGYNRILEQVQMRCDMFGFAEVGEDEPLAAQKATVSKDRKAERERERTVLASSKISSTCKSIFVNLSA